MNEKVDFCKYNMRDNYEFQVFISTLNGDKNDENSILFLNKDASIPGVIIKNGNEVILKVSNILIKENLMIKGITTNKDEIQSEKDGGVLYASTWEGDIQFIIRKFRKIGSSARYNYNSISYGESAEYKVYDMSISSQFNLKDYVYQVSYSMDYIHEWFSIINPKMKKDDLDISVKEIDNLFYKNNKFKLKIRGSIEKKYNINYYKSVASSLITIYFESNQSKDSVYELGLRFRDFFQLILNTKIGISKIIINQNKSRCGDKLLPRDERENWIIDQAYLPNIKRYDEIRNDIHFKEIEENFDTILRNYLENEKLQELIYYFLIAYEESMPVIPRLLTLCSGVEKYLNNLRFDDNNKTVKDFAKKLKHLFIKVKLDERECDYLVEVIKNNRDYYIHGVKLDKKLSEKELVPVINTFGVIIRQYILLEMNILTCISNN